MIKILLIQPPYIQVPGKHSQSPPVPPLGIAYLAAYVREKMRNRAEVKIIDAFSLGYGADKIVEESRKFSPDIAGFTSVTLTANFIKKISPAFRQAMPGALLVAGGPHPSALPGDLLPAVDIAVRGEGELTFHEIAECVEQSKDWRGIPGVSFLDGEDVVNNGQQKFIEDIDSIPFPARDLLPMHLYEHHYPYKTRNRNFTTFFTSRGCPYSCSFCCKHVIWGGNVRFRSLDNTFAEIDSLTKTYDTSFYFFYDDTFTTNKKRIVQFCERIKSGGRDFQWSCLTRADCLDNDLILTMKNAGCVEFQIGIESGSNEVLGKINKKVKLDTLLKTFKLIKSHNMRTKGFFILGHFGDTRKTMDETINMALKLDPSWVFFSTLVPLPGSELFETAKEKGYLETTDWDRYNYHDKPIIHTEHFTSDELDKIRRLAYRRFYLRPKKLIAYALDVIASGGYRRMWNNFQAFMDLSSSSS